jgi:hypothetical protein
LALSRFCWDAEFWGKLLLSSFGLTALTHPFTWLQWWDTDSVSLGRLATVVGVLVEVINTSSPSTQSPETH